MYVLVLTRTKPKQSSLQGFCNQSLGGENVKDAVAPAKYGVV